MKRYLLFLLCLGLFWFTFAQSEESFDSNASCPVFFGAAGNFAAQKLALEYDKQQLKLAINDTYAKIEASSDKDEKAILKDIILTLKKELIVLNYRLFLLYKNEYISRIIN